MRLAEINWNPSPRQLRQFGVACAFMLPLLSWLMKAGEAGMIASVAIGTMIAALSFVWPTSVRVLFVGLTCFTYPIGMLLGEAAMLLIFFGVFLPIGLVFRMIGRDALKRPFDGNVNSYWQVKQEPDSVSSYYRRY